MKIILREITHRHSVYQEYYEALRGMAMDEYFLIDHATWNSMRVILWMKVNLPGKTVGSKFHDKKLRKVFIKNIL